MMKREFWGSLECSCLQVSLSFLHHVKAIFSLWWWSSGDRGQEAAALKVLRQSKLQYVFLPISRFFLCLPAVPPPFSSTVYYRWKKETELQGLLKFVRKRRGTASLFGKRKVKITFASHPVLPATLASLSPCVCFPSISPMCKEVLGTEEVSL